MMRMQSLTGAWQFRQAGTEEWLRATVPGGAHTDLLALERIPDPFVGDNERRVQWVAEAAFASERDWEYRCTFEVAPRLLDEERVFLVCDGFGHAGRRHAERSAGGPRGERIPPLPLGGRQAPG